jgi:peptide/nickel transport system permease protein
MTGEIQAAPRVSAAAHVVDALHRFFDSDVWYSFRRSPVTIVAALVTALFMVSALFAGWVAPHNPFDLSQVDLLDAFIPPVWEVDGDPRFLLGTDDQGRGVLSTIIYGARISLGVGFASVVFAMFLGIGLGLLSGYVGGALDAVIMRVADVQLSFPAILIALLVDGVARSLLPRGMHDEVWFYVLVFAIGISGWVQYARTVRGSTLVEKGKEYVQAARVIGVPPGLIMLRHVLPNVMGPVLVIATIHLAIAIITEATLSFFSGRQRLPFLRRVVDHDIPRRGTGDPGFSGQLAGRLAA